MSSSIYVSFLTHLDFRKLVIVSQSRVLSSAYNFFHVIGRELGRNFSLGDYASSSTGRCAGRCGSELESTEPLSTARAPGSNLHLLPRSLATSSVWASLVFQRRSRGCRADVSVRGMPGSDSGTCICVTQFTRKEKDTRTHT